MTYDAKTSREILGYLIFSVNMSRKPHHLKEFAHKNREIIECLTDDDKEALRGAYRQTKLRKAEMEYDRKNTFILSRNDRKEKETHPDFTGSLTDGEGREFWLNAWVKESKGRKFFSGSVKPKDGKPAGASGRSLAEDIDDSIPF